MSCKSDCNSKEESENKDREQRKKGINMEAYQIPFFIGSFIFYRLLCASLLFKCIPLNSDGVQPFCILNMRMNAEMLEKPHRWETSLMDREGSIKSVVACIILFLFRY
jgi:hypothetical protein